MNHADALERTIWLQLDNGIWPKELFEIKPKKWDQCDLNEKGKLVLKHLGQIIYQSTLLTNARIIKHEKFERVSARSHLFNESSMFP